ncbi:hypothetical protein SDC9_170507 [bioreactor metagenome]|uniref:Uncharacterized protein n=1 Tax=bioreactor metagenome TaxID=1076179 RepID=A0A645G887_9ZZZZ
MMNKITAVFGIIAINTNASSPEEAIIIATNAPKLRRLWVNNETTANPPIQPGIIPSRVATNTCLTGDFFNFLKEFP